MTLQEYISRVRELLHDPNNNFWSDVQLTGYINRSRKQVAKMAQCVRILPPSTASLSSITVNSGGTGYTTATVAIAKPDGVGQNYIQATATATVGGGMVTGITITNPGTGYVDVPSLTITGNGTGAIATPILSPHVFTVTGQEKYDFSTINQIIQSLYPGAGTILGVQTIAVSWGAMKPVLDRCDWSSFQAYARSYNTGFMNYPKVWAQYGQGDTGSAYFWPIPSLVSQVDFDCYCSVLDLSALQLIDLIPEPWSEPVCYYAAYYAYMNAQRFDDARTVQAEHTRLMIEARVAVSPAAWVPSYYGDGS